MSRHLEPPAAECPGCGLPPSRRDFLLRLATAAIGAMVLSGVPLEAARAMTPTRLRRRDGRTGDPRYPIPAADGVQIDHDEEVILVRWHGTLAAFNLSCPHQHTALRWDEADAQFRCPKHKSRYQPDGAFVSGRATRNMDRFGLTRDGNDVVVHVNQMHKSDEDPSGWSAASLALGE